MKYVGDLFVIAAGENFNRMPCGLGAFALTSL